MACEKSTYAAAPIDMVLHCPACGMQHIDASNEDEIHIAVVERGFVLGSRDWEDFIEENVWTNPPHRSHLCHGCGHVWRPADVPTNGVEAVKTKGQNDSELVRCFGPGTPVKYVEPGKLVWDEPELPRIHFKFKGTT